MTRRTRRICLSSLTVDSGQNEDLILAGEWCRTFFAEQLLTARKAPYSVVPPRFLLEQQFRNEAEECLYLYIKYSAALASELNRIHGVAHSQRYWETVLNRFLYSLIAAVIDKHATLLLLKEHYPDAEVDIADYRTLWTSPHTFPGLGGSRLLHLLIYSVIVPTTKLFRYRIISSDRLQYALISQGDGKKDIRSSTNAQENRRFRTWARTNRWLKWPLMVFRAIKKGELPFGLIRYLNPSVIPLGNQYLKRLDLTALLIKARSIPFYFSSEGWGGAKFSPYDLSRRDLVCFPKPESTLEECLQVAIRRFLPTVFLENYDVVTRMAREMLPKGAPLILNSQNHSGGDFVDFFVAHVVEERNASHMMVCHGGCYGVMDISVQEQIWARTSDTYALWSDTREYGLNCDTIKLPSLRFHKWLGHRGGRRTKSQILVFLTGHYPQRYAYNSIYPYTIDGEYDDWQIRFLAAVDKNHHGAIVLRDYHRSSDISRGTIRKWAEEHEIQVEAGEPLEVALQKCKLAVQSVPQTTYLETLTANQPTIGFWNPASNIIRSDLMRHFDELAAAGVLHKTPESAASKLNEVATDPIQWWNTPKVQSAVEAFRRHVCHTSPAAMSEWAAYIRRRY